MILCAVRRGVLVLADAGRSYGHAAIFAAASQEEAQRAARRYAQALLCRSGGAVPCGRCPDCRKVEAGIHPDLITVARQEDDKGRLKKEIVVDQIREMNDDACVLPNEAARKVYLIAEADKMNPAAQNAALKLLEEPPNGAVFLLCVTNPALLLPTVRSRCEERRSAAAEEAPDEESRKLAEACLRAAASRAELVRWCFAQDALDLRQTQAMIEALRYTVTDMLAGRRDSLGFGRRELSQLAALASRCADYLRVNVNAKHILGLLAAEMPLSGGNRG